MTLVYYSSKLNVIVGLLSSKSSVKHISLFTVGLLLVNHDLSLLQ